MAAAVGRPCAWVACAGLGSARPSTVRTPERPGRIAEEQRRVGVRNPVFVLDEAGGAREALLEAVDPAPGAAFRDRYLDLPLDLSGALFVATPNSLGAVPRGVESRGCNLGCLRTWTASSSSRSSQ